MGVILQSQLLLTIVLCVILFIVLVSGSLVFNCDQVVKHTK